MKRLSNLYVKICDLDNLKLADKKASRGKSGQFGVITHNKNKEKNLELLRQQLIDKTFSTSEY